MGATPISQSDSHLGRYFLAAIACLLLVTGWASGYFDAKRRYRPGRPAKHLWTTAWLCLSLLSIGNYYQFDSKKVTTVDNYGDVTYYYLNSKYFQELGYTNLYRAMLVADDEGQKAFRKVRQYRDLVRYEDFYPRKRALSEKKEIKALFSHERWESFREDLRAIVKRQGDGWKYFFTDHGYNPPPPWTLVGGQLASWVDVQHLKRITSIDIVLVAAVFGATALVLSLETAAIGTVFFCTTFSGRWPILGQALLRFDWLAMLIFAVLFLKAKRPGWAGACLMYATAVRIFPGIFAIPCIAVLLRQSVRKKAIDRDLVWFAAGAAVCSLVLVGGAYARYGAQAFSESYTNLALHGSPESFSSHRVGLGDALLYRGEWSNRDLARSGGISEKRAALWALMPYLKALGAASVAVLIWRAWRSRAPAHRMLWLGIYPLFILTTPQINYYNLRLLLVFFHAPSLHDERHRIGLTMLFLIEVITQAAMVHGAIRYCVTAWTSVGLLAYLCVMGVLFLRPPDQPRLASPSPSF